MSKNQPKQNVTLREALEEERQMNAKDGKTRASAAADGGMGDGDKQKAPPRPKIPSGSKPFDVLGIHLGSKEAVFKAVQLQKGDTVNDEYADNVGSRINALAKKVAEKAVNLLRYRQQPESIQGYTRQGLDLLVAQGEVTSKQLTDHLRRKYTDGTARAQANQVFQLFPALGIAERSDKSTMRLSKTSAIVADYTRATKA